jgi:hypothetical protein
VLSTLNTCTSCTYIDIRQFILYSPCTITKRYKLIRGGNRFVFNTDVITDFTICLWSMDYYGLEKISYKLIIIITPISDETAQTSRTSRSGRLNIPNYNILLLYF